MDYFSIVMGGLSCGASPANWAGLVNWVDIFCSIAFADDLWGSQKARSGQDVLARLTGLARSI